MTPDRRIFSEGARLVPTAFARESFEAVVCQSDFVRHFGNLVIASLTTAAATTLIAVSAGYGLSRFDFRGKRVLIALMLVTQMFPLPMIIATIY